MKQPSAQARTAALETLLGISSQPKEVDVKKIEGKTPKEPSWRRNRGNPVVMCQALGSKRNELG